MAVLSVLSGAAAAQEPARVVPSLPGPMTTVQETLHVLASTSWDFAVATFFLGAVTALILEAVEDFGLRRYVNRRTVARFLRCHESDLWRMGISGAVTALRPEELCGQLASLASTRALPMGYGPDSDVPTVRSALLSARPVLVEPGQMDEDRARVEAAAMERELDALQMRLGIQSRRLELALSLGLTAVMVIAVVAGIYRSGFSAAATAASIAGLVAVAAGLAAPLLRSVLRGAMRRI